MNVVILAAGMGTRLGDLTRDLPKGMVNLHGKGLLDWHTQTLKSAGFNSIILVGGYQSEKLEPLGCPVILNKDFDSTNMVISLNCASESFDHGFITAYGDILYNTEIIQSLAEDSWEGISVVSDRQWQKYWEDRGENILDDAESFMVNDNGFISSLGQKVKSESRIEEEIQGQYIGLIRFGKEGVQELKQAIADEQQANAAGHSLLCPGKTLANMYMTDLLQGMINRGTQIKPIWTDGGWFEVDTPSDLVLAQKITSELDDGENTRLVVNR